MAKDALFIDTTEFKRMLTDPEARTKIERCSIALILALGGWSKDESGCAFKEHLSRSGKLGEIDPELVDFIDSQPRIPKSKSTASTLLELAIDTRVEMGGGE